MKIFSKTRRFFCALLAFAAGAASLAFAKESVVKSWDFSEDLQGWIYGAGWEYQYSNGASSSVSYDAERKALKATVDYSANSNSSWSQMAVCIYDSALNFSTANTLSFNFYYDSSKMSRGSFLVKVFSNAGIEQNVSLGAGSTDSGSIKKVPVRVSFDAVVADATPDFALCIVGSNTDYKGDIWIDDVTLICDTSKKEMYVNSKIKPRAARNITASAASLSTFQKNGKKIQTTPFAKEIRLVDPKADAKTAALYAYLDAVGKSASVIFGHQDDTWAKAGRAKTSSSDTFDVTGQYAGVVGFDTLSLTGAEYSAGRYNSEIAEPQGLEKLDINAMGEVYANVVAAAKLTNINLKNGSIITLSAHMPNFSLVKPKSGGKNGKTYERYDFSGYTPNTLTGDVANNLLPGGKYNEVYKAFLDMVADYASMVEGPILFRPFHEWTGSWFWWGAALCNPETAKNIFRYTVTYLRDEKNVHNFLYSYGPSSDATSLDDYAVRYPGDEYVDMVGFDMYHQNPQAKDTAYFNNFKNQLNIVGTFAKQHGKLMAVTETGMASSPDKGDNQTALHKTGNLCRDWYNLVLNAVSASDASYFLLWANFSKNDGFYTPYVERVNADGSLYGHEMLDNFISYYNDGRSIFAEDQKQVLETLDKTLASLVGNVKAVSENARGYITSPIADKRILNPVLLSARIETPAQKVSFVVKGNSETEFLASVSGNAASVMLDASSLAALGESVSGKISLNVDGKILQTIPLIFNIPEPVPDPFEVDGFENYYGSNDLLSKAWTKNQDTGCAVEFVHTKENVPDGTYALEFRYKETKTGWGGATINLEADWSSRNALSFYTRPDGNLQKTVIQITANDIVYEAYLQLYEDYAKIPKGKLVRVTIPFAEFVMRDVAGNPAGDLVDDCYNINSFGLWVNALANTKAAKKGSVEGVLIYDKITAVSSDVEKAVFEIVE